MHACTEQRSRDMQMRLGCRRQENKGAKEDITWNSRIVCWPCCLRETGGRCRAEDADWLVQATRGPAVDFARMRQLQPNAVGMFDAVTRAANTGGPSAVVSEGHTRPPSCRFGPGKKLRRTTRRSHWSRVHLRQRT